MLCPKCNSELKEGMLFCPECGAKLEIPQAAPAVEAAQAEPQAEAAQAETPVFDQPAFRLNMEGAAPEKKKMDPKKKKTVIRVTALITALALIITGVLGFVLGDWGAYLSDFFARMQSPEKYKTQVEQEALTDPDAMSEIGALKKAVMDYYRLLKAGQQYNSANVGMTLMLGDGAQELLDSLGGLGLDEDLLALLQQLEELELRMDYSVTQEGMQGKLDLGLNGVNLASLDFLMDLVKGDMYMALPGLADGYAKVDGKELGLEEMTQLYPELFALSQEWVELLPEEEAVEELIDRCFLAAMDEITEVEKANKTLSVGDVEQTVTVLTYELTEEDAANVALAVLKELEGDETVMALLEAYAYYTNELNSIYREITPDLADLYPTVDPEEAMDAITEAINELEEYEPESDETLKIDTYVNKKGQIVGRKFWFPEELGEISYVTLESGNKLAFRLLLDADGEEMEFSFEGTKKQDKLTGTGYLDIDGDEYLVVKLEGFDLNARTGKIRIELGKSLQKLVKEELGTAASLGLSGIALDIEIQTNEVTLWVCLSKQQLLGLKVDYSMSDRDVEIEVPANATTDLEKWVASLDPQALLDNLEKAGITEDMLQALLGALDDTGTSIL